MTQDTPKHRAIKAWLAEYEFDMPEFDLPVFVEPTIERRSWIVTDEGQEFFVNEEAVDYLRSKGVTINVEERVELPEVNRSWTHPEFAKQLKRLEKEFRGYWGVSDGERDGVGVWGYGPKHVEVVTPTGHGKREHEARRAAVESLLREWGIEFTLECRAVINEDSCKPLTVVTA